MAQSPAGSRELGLANPDNIQKLHDGVRLLAERDAELNLQKMQAWESLGTAGQAKVVAHTSSVVLFLNNAVTTNKSLAKKLKTWTAGMDAGIVASAPIWGGYDMDNRQLRAENEQGKAREAQLQAENERLRAQLAQLAPAQAVGSPGAALPAAPGGSRSTRRTQRAASVETNTTDTSDADTMNGAAAAAAAPAAAAGAAAAARQAVAAGQTGLGRPKPPFFARPALPQAPAQPAARAARGSERGTRSRDGAPCLSGEGCGSTRSKSLRQSPRLASKRGPEQCNNINIERPAEPGPVSQRQRTQ